MEKVFFIGDVALDEYYQADYFPKLKEKIIVHTLPAQMGGSMANAACVFAALGNQPGFLTALNSGAITQQLMRGLHEAGISTEHMVFDDSIPDAKCLIILAENEHTVFIPTLALQRIDISEAAFTALRECDYIYTNFCEIRPLRCGERDVYSLLSELLEHGTRIWCDLDCADLSDEEVRLFPFMDAIFINEKGAENLEKRYGAGWKQELFSQGVRIITETQAENGCVISTSAGEAAAIPGVSVEVEDVTGAGDTFCSSFLHGYIRSGDIRRAGEFANYVAARAVTGLGARYGVTDAGTLRRFIDEHGGSSADFEDFFN